MNEKESTARWTTALFIALPLAWILMNTVGLRWEVVAPNDYRPSMWGAPLPWIHASPVTSLRWNLCYPFLILDLIVYTLPLTVLLAMLPFKHPHAPWRVCAAVLLLLSVVPALLMATGGVDFILRFDLSYYNDIRFAVELWK